VCCKDGLPTGPSMTKARGGWAGTASGRHFSWEAPCVGSGHFVVLGMGSPEWDVRGRSGEDKEM
jgi:hypothetical protein